MYADGQPAFSYIMLLLHQHAGLSKAGVVAVFNSAMIASFIAGIYYVHKTLHYFGMPRWLAVVLSVCIIAMSPQVFRITGGHYALSYLFVIPAIIYWMVRYDNSSRLKYALYILLLSLLMAFIHPYFIAVSFLLVCFYAFAHYCLSGHSIMQKIKHIIPLFASVAFVLMAVRLFSFITDPVTDRTKYPHGTMSYFTVKADLLSSPYSPVMQLIKNRFYISAEGFAYIGVIPIVLLLVYIIALLLPASRKHTVHNKWLLISLCSLLMAMGVPFIWNMEWLMDYLSLFRQFRTIGRFVWIYYYITTIFMAVWMFQAYKAYAESTTKRLLLNTIIFVSTAIWGIEAYGYMQEVRGKLASAGYNYLKFHYWGKKDLGDFLKEHAYTSDSFQAIIVVPFSHIGSEKIWMGEQATYALTNGMQAATSTGLPLVNASMSRSSWLQAFNQVRIAGGPFASKPLLNTTNSQKPFLLLHYPAEPMMHDEQYLIDHSTYLGTVDGASVYTCYPARLMAADNAMRDSAVRIMQQMHANDTAIGTVNIVYSRSFDEKTTLTTLIGNGAALHRIGMSDTFAVWKIQNASQNVLYEFSAWTLVSDADYKSPEFNLKYYDKHGNLLRLDKVFTKSSADSYKMWMRASAKVNMPFGTEIMVCTVYGAGNKKNDFIAIDEIMLRPDNSLVISIRQPFTMVNNHIFTTGK
ncbi:hypothetical protein CAP35_05815 [Chitinophagaceae bacterium IBVUCB1]|nr:hypothetical protein CAP35_05815 [Chitinophagaceae bacterium IBVUCB1]